MTTISINNDQITAQFKTLGAELFSLKDKNNKEFIWEGNPNFWGKHSPILFPIVGSLKNNTFEYPKNKMEVFSQFHDTLYEGYSESLSGATHILLKMHHLWEYFSVLFSNPHKVHKNIKKAKSIKNYEATVKEIIAKEQ